MPELDRAESMLEMAVVGMARQKDFSKKKDILDYSEEEMNGNCRTYDKTKFISSAEAVAEGWDMPISPPEPEKCKYCGNELPHLGAKAVNGERKVILWFDAVTCDCEYSVRERHLLRQEAEEKEQEEKRLRQAEIQQKRRERVLQVSGMSPRFYDRRFNTFELEDYNKEAFLAAKFYAEHFSDMLPRSENGRVLPPTVSKNGLLFTGSQGTGKTHLAAAVANRLLDRGTGVICMTMIDLLDRIKATFYSSEISSRDVLKLYEEIPLLIIDDLGSEQPTEWGASTIFQIINARYEGYMPIIITTNYSGKELIARMTPPNSDGRNAEKTVDRLVELCKPIKMYWYSYRRKANDGQ